MGPLTTLQRTIMKQSSLCSPLRVEVEDDSETLSDPSHLVGYSRKPHLVELKHTFKTVKPAEYCVKRSE